MKPWPLTLLSLVLRFAIIPIVLWLVLSTVAEATNHPILVANTFTVVVINLMIFQFEEHHRRIRALEEDLSALRRTLSAGAK
jgi:hypothetical protein